MIPLEQKTLLTKKKDKRAVGIPIMLVQVWNTNIVHVKEQRQGLQKCRPGGELWFLRGHWKRAEFPTTYSLLETRFTSPVGHTTSVCPSNNNVLLFPSGLIHKDRNICEGFVMAKAFLYREDLLTFILQGELQSRGSQGIKPVIDEAWWFLWDFEARGRGELRGVLKPHAAHFIPLIFLWRTLKSAADAAGGGREGDRGDAPAARHWTVQVE